MMTAAKKLYKKALTKQAQNRVRKISYLCYCVVESYFPENLDRPCALVDWKLDKVGIATNVKAFRTGLIVTLLSC